MRADPSQARVLWVTDEPPRLARGGSGIRQFHLFKALAAAFPTDLLVVGAVEDSVRAAAARVIELPPRRALWTEHPVGRRVLELAIALGSSNPSAACRVVPSRRALAGAIRRLEHRYTLVYVEPQALAPLIAVRRSEKWMLTFHLFFSGLIKHQLALAPGRRQRWALSRDLRKAERFERRALSRYDRVVAVSEPDAAWLRELGGAGAAARISVIPNGVDLESFTPTSVPKGPRVLFPGSFDTGPNVDGALWFCSEIWPRIKAAVPQATLQLVGRAPVEAVVRLQGAPDVTLDADVPSIEPYFAAARVIVVPLRIGTGTRLKALEAMASGRPVVGTTIGLEGLGVVDGSQALVRDDSAAIADAVIKTLNDDALARSLAASGRAHVEARFGWDRVGRDFVEVVSELLARS